MIVKTRFQGVLADWITSETIHFNMEPRSTYGDLLKKIGDRFSDNMPDQLWDKKLAKFKSVVLAVGKDRNLESIDTQLTPNEEIAFYLMLAGG